MATLTLHLTLKNLCSGIAALATIILAVIVGVVPADSLKDWRWVIYALGAVAVVAAVTQMFLQSHEDKDLARKVDSLLATRGVEPSAKLMATASMVDDIAIIDARREPGIDGEVYRLAVSPKTMAWEITKGIYAAANREFTEVIDTDILVEMYLVNTAKDKTKYVRELRLSVEISGKTVQFKQQNDLAALEFGDHEFEYGLRSDPNSNFGDVEPIKQLANQLPFALAPEQPVEGWVRFMATKINPDNIVQGTVRLTVIDSLGNEYFIHKVPERLRRGELALRRV